MKTPCTFCGSAVDTKKDWRKVTGWEHPRSAGGTNALALRVTEFQFACDKCINERRRREVKGQVKLWA